MKVKLLRECVVSHKVGGISTGLHIIAVDEMEVLSLVEHFWLLSN